MSNIGSMSKKCMNVAYNEPKSSQPEIVEPITELEKIVRDYKDIEQYARDVNAFVLDRVIRIVGCENGPDCGVEPANCKPQEICNVFELSQSLNVIRECLNDIRHNVSRL